MKIQDMQKAIGLVFDDAELFTYHSRMLRSTQETGGHSMNIHKLKSDVKEAQALLEQAKTDYAKAVMEAIDKGTLVEIRESAWVTRHTMTSPKVYCHECHAVTPNGLMHAFCPACGAKMRNGTWKPHYVENVTVIDADETDEIDEKADKSDNAPDNTVISAVPTVKEKSVSDKTARQRATQDQHVEERREQVNLLHDIKAAKYTHRDIAKMLHCDASNISFWSRGLVTCKPEMLDAIRKLHSDIFTK